MSELECLMEDSKPYNGEAFMTCINPTAHGHVACGSSCNHWCSECPKSIRVIPVGDDYKKVFTFNLYSLYEELPHA